MPQAVQTPSPPNWWEQDEVVEEEKADFWAQDTVVSEAPEVAAPEAVPAADVNVAGDVLRSIPTGVRQGAEGLVGGPKSLAQMAADVGAEGSMLLSEGLYRLQGQDAEQARSNARLFERDIRGVMQAVPETVMPNLPSVEQVQEATTGVFGAPREPLTEAGETARNITAFATEAAGGGGLRGLGSRVAQGLGAGAGAEAVSEAFEGTSAEIPAYIIGSLLGGTASSAAAVYRSTPERMVSRRLAGMTERQWEQAQNLETAAKELGIPLMGPESLDSPTLRGLAADVYRSEGGEAIAEAARGRVGPFGTQELAVTNLIEGVSPPTSISGSPSVIASGTREAAEGAITTARKRVTDATAPIYAGAIDDIIPQNQMDDLISEIGANRNIPESGPLARIRDELVGELQVGDALRPETNAARLNTTLKGWQERLSLGRGDEGYVNAASRGILGPYLSRLQDIVEEGSDSVRLGNERYSELTEELVRPLTRGLEDRLRRGTTATDATSPLTDYKNTSPQEIRDTMARLATEGPEIPRSLTRLWLETAWDAASKDETLRGAARLRSSVFGTGRQRENMRAMLDSLDVTESLPVGTRYQAMVKVMDVLQRTDRIPIPADLRRSVSSRSEASANLMGGVLGTDVTRPLARIARIRDSVVQGRNYSALADAFTHPDSVSILRQMANADGYNPAMESLVVQLLTLGAAEQATSIDSSSNEVGPPQ